VRASVINHYRQLFQSMNFEILTFDYFFGTPTQQHFDNTKRAAVYTFILPLSAFKQQL